MSLLPEPRSLVKQRLVDLRRIAVFDHVVDDLAHRRSAGMSVLSGGTFGHPGDEFAKAFDADGEHQLEF